MTSTPDRITLRLQAVEYATAEIRLFTLRDPGGADLPPFTPGAHLALTLPSGLERQYSLCSDPADRSAYVVAVKREAAGRGGSAEMHTLLPGVLLPSRLPANHFPLADAPALPLLIAGGIGVTPVMAMVRSLIAEGRDFRLLFLARSRAEAAFVDDLTALVPAHRLAFHFDDSAGGFCDLKGWLSAEPGTVHCCGPAPLMDAVRRAGADLGWPETHLRFEAFVNSQPAQVEGDRPFTVTLARRKRSVAVAADETLLDALLKAGIDVDYSCTEGTCGTCITRVLAGAVDHRDAVLMPHEKPDHIVLCCSRARDADLVLDL